MFMGKPPHVADDVIRDGFELLQQAGCTHREEAWSILRRHERESFKAIIRILRREQPGWFTKASSSPNVRPVHQ